MNGALMYMSNQAPVTKYAFCQRASQTPKLYTYRQAEITFRLATLHKYYIICLHIDTDEQKITHGRPGCSLCNYRNQYALSRRHVHAVEVDGANTTNDSDLPMDGIEMYDGDGEECSKKNGVMSAHTKTDARCT